MCSDVDKMRGMKFLFAAILVLVLSACAGAPVDSELEPTLGKEVDWSKYSARGMIDWEYSRSSWMSHSR